MEQVQDFRVKGSEFHVNPGQKGQVNESEMRTNENVVSLLDECLESELVLAAIIVIASDACVYWFLALSSCGEHVNNVSYVDYVEPDLGTWGCPHGVGVSKGVPEDWTHILDMLWVEARSDLCADAVKVGDGIGTIDLNLRPWSFGWRINEMLIQVLVQPTLFVVIPYLVDIAPRESEELVPLPAEGGESCVIEAKSLALGMTGRNIMRLGRQRSVCRSSQA